MKKFVMKKKEVMEDQDPVDQANEDLRFVESFIALLFEISGNGSGVDAISNSTISIQCYESLKKIKNLHRFIAAIPINTVKAA